MDHKIITVHHISRSRGSDMSLPNPGIDNTRYSLLNERLTPRNDFGRDTLYPNVYKQSYKPTEYLQGPLLERSCYCTKNTRRYSDGKQYCGKCQTEINGKRCDSLGHTCHHPGGVPYTGSWCDFHYLELLKK